MGLLLPASALLLPPPPGFSGEVVEVFSVVVSLAGLLWRCRCLRLCKGVASR